VGLPKDDFTVGAPADFQLVEGECVPQIVVDVPNASGGPGREGDRGEREAHHG